MMVHSSDIFILSPCWFEFKRMRMESLILSFFWLSLNKTFIYAIERSFVHDWMVDEAQKVNKQKKFYYYFHFYFSSIRWLIQTYMKKVIIRGF